MISSGLATRDAAAQTPPKRNVVRCTIDGDHAQYTLHTHSQVSPYFQGHVTARLQPKNQGFRQFHATRAPPPFPSRPQPTWERSSNTGVPHSAPTRTFPTRAVHKRLSSLPCTWFTTRHDGIQCKTKSICASGRIVHGAYNVKLVGSHVFKVPEGACIGVEVLHPAPNLLDVSAALGQQLQGVGRRHHLLFQCVVSVCCCRRLFVVVLFKLQPF